MPHCPRDWMSVSAPHPAACVAGSDAPLANVNKPSAAHPRTRRTARVAQTEGREERAGSIARKLRSGFLRVAGHPPAAPDKRYGATVDLSRIVPVHQGAAN